MFNWDTFKSQMKSTMGFIIFMYILGAVLALVFWVIMKIVIFIAEHVFDCDHVGRKAGIPLKARKPRKPRKSDYAGPDWDCAKCGETVTKKSVRPHKCEYLY